MSEIHKTWFSNELLFSKAWLALTGKSPQIFAIFYSKRQMLNVNKKKGKKANWHCENERNINFTYSEAKRLKFTEHQFRHAIDQLIDVGLLDIEEYGGGTVKLKTVFALSRRWKTYDTDEFERAARVKCKRGFCADGKRYNQDTVDGD